MYKRQILRGSRGREADHRAAVSIWLSAVDIVAARMPARMSPARQCLPVRMKKMMKIKKMTDYFAASPSGKMILFTKKMMTIEMPPLSTVVPML